MKPDYIKILVEHNLSSIFLDQSGCVEAMEICYEMGKKDGLMEILDWLSKTGHITNNTENILDEWKNQNILKNDHE